MKIARATFWRPHPKSTNVCGGVVDLAVNLDKRYGSKGASVWITFRYTTRTTNKDAPISETYWN